MEFGELRMLCQEEPSSAAWLAIVATLEAKHAIGGAHAEEAEQLWLPYADDALARWPHDLRAATATQLNMAEAGQRVVSMRLVRHLSWSGWPQRDMARFARCPDLVALPSLRLYQTHDADLKALTRARPELLGRVEQLRLDACLFQWSEGALERFMEVVCGGGMLHTLHSDGANMRRLLPLLTRHAAHIKLRALHLRDGALVEREQDAYALLAWLDAGGAAQLREIKLLQTTMTDEAMALLERCPRLTSLGMRAYDLPDHDLHAALARVPIQQLTTLELGIIGMPQAHVEPLSDLLHMIPSLRTLQLHEAWRSTERASSPALDALAPLPIWLDDVSISTISTSSSPVPPERLHVPGMRPRVLRISKAHAASPALGHLLDQLELSGVTQLKLTNSTIGPERLGELARREMPALRSADLWGCALTDRGVEILAGGAWGEQLRALDLTGDRLTQACIPALSDLLRRGALRQLSLDSNEEGLAPDAIARLMEAAIPRAAPLQLSAHTRTGPHQVARRCPPRADATPWPAHIQFEEIAR